MKAPISALLLIVSTAAAVAIYPTVRGNPTPPPDPVPLPIPDTRQTPRIDVVFALDTTGSMGGLIQGAKDTIFSIANGMAQADPAPIIRMGLVAYRDRGDAYVTQVIDLSDDLDSVYARLMEFQAAGGGDGPESVNQALHDAVHRMSWSADEQAYKVVFLVGDAPPHMDYPDEVPYPETLSVAAQRGIVVNAIQCGGHTQTARIWQRIAQSGSGRFFQVEQSGGAVAMTTPFDERLAELSAALDRTRLYFGSADQRRRAEDKVMASEKVHAEAPASVRAARAGFNLSAAGERNLLGDDELVDAVASGRVELDELDETELPEPLQVMAPEERESYVEEQAARRDALKQEIAELNAEREGYLRKHRESAAADGFDAKVDAAVREQAAAKGIRYGEEDDG